jgi:para-nitrobenzyl esterase
VVVFLYGGGFTIGSSGTANYDGEAMAKAGASLSISTIAWGYGLLAHPELTKEGGAWAITG